MISSLQSLVNDISVIWSAFTLPVNEPLTPEKLRKLSKLTLSCLYAALSTSMAMNILGLSSSLSPKTSSITPDVTKSLNGKFSFEILSDKKFNKFVSSVSWILLHCNLYSDLVLNVLGSTILNVKSDEDNSEVLAASVVEKAIIIFNHVSNIMKESSRAGGYVSLKYLKENVFFLFYRINPKICISDLSKSRLAWSVVIDFWH